jgi:endoglucanase
VDDAEAETLLRFALKPGLAAALVVVLAAVALVAPADAATTQRGSCTDGGGTRWSAQVVWAEAYRLGVWRTSAPLQSVSWTTTRRTTPTDSVVRVRELTTSGRTYFRSWTGRFNYRSGAASRVVNFRDAVSAAGRVEVQLSLGVDGDGRRSCSLTFRQPVAEAAPSMQPALNLWRAPRPHDDIVGRGSQFDLFASQPTFSWIGEWESEPRAKVAEYVRGAAGRTVPLVLYAFPRDGYSRGGLATFASYKAWVDQVSSGLGSGRALVVLEPDALGLQTPMTDGTTPERAIGYAVSKLRASNRNAQLYLEASSWIDPASQAQRLRDANIAEASGFATNVSGFVATSAMTVYAEQVVDHLTRLDVPNKHYLIDTGRNGKGELGVEFGPLARPWLDRGLNWLNPPGRGLGLSPRTMADPSAPGFKAAVWIKPPGYSDGNDPGSGWTSPYFSSRAPDAGQFWLEWTMDALAHTDPGNLQPPGK